MHDAPWKFKNEHSCEYNHWISMQEQTNHMPGPVIMLVQHTDQGSCYRSYLVGHNAVPCLVGVLSADIC